MAMILSFAASIQAAEVTETIAMKKFGGLSTSSYENVTKTGTSDLGTEMVAYAFNPTTGQVRGNKTTIAGASVTSADANKNWSLYNSQAMPGAIKSIKVTQTATGSNKFQNNLYVALGTTNQGAVTTVTGAQKNTTGTTTKFTFDIDETQGYTYFKLLSNVKFTSNSVAGVVVTVTYVTGNEDPDATMYTVTTKVNDETMGTVTGAGEYAEGKTATLTANPNTGYKFVNWSNGETANPLKLTVTENVEITANFAVIPPMTCAEAAATASGETVVLNPFDVVYVVKDAGYIYIKDESGFNLIYDFNLDDKLKAGDHVEGFVGVSSPYNGLPELKASVSYNELTVTSGVAPEPTVMAAAPTKAELNQYVKFENVTLTANTTFSTSSATNATMVVNGTNVTLRNNFKLAATLSKDKAYNIVGFVAIYNSTIQVYYLSAEEYVAPAPCTLATPVNWDDAINAEANTDQWYAVNVKSAIAAGKDLALTVTNPGTEAVDITIEAYADCPATELIVKSTKTFNAGETKTTTVKYDEYLADQVEVVYLHVVTSGDLTIGTEAIEPCSKATAINWNDPIAAAANLDAWYAVNVESAIAAGKDLALTVSNPSTEAVEVSIEAYADCPATELIVKSTSTINAGASKTTTVKYDEYLADQVKVVYMHVTTKGGEIKVEAETVKFNVTATAENGTVEGAGVYEQGTEATLTATPAEGYEFVNWTSGETVVSTENPYKFTVTADVALVANFKEVVNVVTKEEKTTCVPGTLADGKVTHDLPCCVIVQEQGESTTALKSVAPWEAPAKSIMTITPKEGVTILKYVVNTKNTTLGTYLGKSELTNATKTATSNGLVTFTVTNGTEPVVMKFVSTTIKFHEITFTYTVAGATEPVKYTVTVKAENGTVEGAGEYEEGAEATLTATANEGYEFVNWTVEGTEVSTENPYKFNVTADVEVVANFKEAAVVEPTTETVYFINNKGWSKVNVYAWEPQNANWPGVAATKEAEQIGGYDVYSYTADAGKYANVIFNNGSGSQTADLKWTAGKYVINNQWYTKEEAEAQLVKPVEYEYVYFVNVQAWNKVNIYTWTPEVGTWPGVAMTKEAEQLAGYDVYSYKAEKGTSFGGVIFNNGSGVQTGDLKWTAGKYYVKDGWYTKEEAIEKLSGPVTPPVITYVLMGIAGDWTTGIALTVNPDNENEYVLLGQEIAEGDAVKVVTLTDGVATAWCGNVDPASAAYTADDMGNIVLAPGKYDFYFKVKEDLIYIGAVKPEVITYELNGGEFPAVVVPTNAELWEAFKPYYNTYYGLARADQPIDKVSTFASAKMQEIMTDEASEYKWLGDYVQSVATAAGVPLSTDMASANESGWRWAVHAFFNAAAGQYGAAGIDFTEAGKPENWGAAYEAEYGVVLPTEPVAEDYVLPTPTKEGYIFVGWYDNAEGTGEPYKVIPAGWAGTLYAIWKQDTTTALDNIAVEGKAVKAIINGQLIIIKNGVQYNAQGVILK